MIARLFATAVVLVAAGSPAFAQIGKDSKLLAPFKAVVAKANESTVRIKCNDKDTILGTVVGADGYILTKWSELKGTAWVRLPDGSEYEATTVAAHTTTDLALLKVDVNGLKAVTFADTAKVPVGNWLAASGPTSDPVSVGVVSVKTRRLTGLDRFPPNPNRGLLGVMPADEKDAKGKPIGAKITEIVSGGAADKAGLKTNDVIVELNGKPVVDSDEMREMLYVTRGGDVVKVKVKRDGETKEFKVTLIGEAAPAGKGGGGKDRDMNTLGSGPGSTLSTRRTGFPQVLQTDLVIDAKDCGGPVVDLDGNVLGINIARAGRVETWILPSEVIRPLLPDFMAGKFPPPPPPKAVPVAPAPREKK